MHKRAIVVAIIGLAVSAVACGDENDDGRSTVASTTTVVTTTTAPTADLSALLLDVADVGEGWSATTALSPEDLGSIADSPCAALVMNPTIIERLKPTTGVQFQPTDGSKRGLQEVALTGDPARLPQDLQAVFDGIAEVCAGVESTTPDAERIRYEPFAVPALGDQRLAIIWTAHEPPEYQVTWRGHTAIVRVGAIAIMLTQFDILPTPQDEPLMSDAEFVEVLRKAVDKLSG